MTQAQTYLAVAAAAVAFFMSLVRLTTSARLRARLKDDVAIWKDAPSAAKDDVEHVIKKQTAQLKALYSDDAKLKRDDALYLPVWSVVAAWMLIYASVSAWPDAARVIGTVVVGGVGLVIFAFWTSAREWKRWHKARNPD